jgi:hypothetical protein
VGQLCLLIGLSFGAGWAGAPALAAVQGSARALPYAQAMARSRAAAEAVLGRAGAESCLRGKLTNALLGMSASCQAEAADTPLCHLAERAVVQLSWSLPFMDSTSRELLQLVDSGHPSPQP